jgi:carboxypeptidase family protein
VHNGAMIGRTLRQSLPLPRHVLFALAVCASACGGTTPTPPTPTTPVTPVTPTPTPTPTPPAPTTATVTGRVIAVNGGQGLSGVTVSLGSATVTTDGTGAYTSPELPFGSLRVTLTAAGIVPRSVTAAVNASRTLPLDAIALSGGFDQTFYRQFVRNTLDAPDKPEPLRRWTRTTQVYLKTVDESGFEVALNDSRLLDAAEQIAREMIPIWSAGTIGVTNVVRGTETREGQAGWLTIRWLANGSEPGVCGNAVVGGDVINLNWRNQGCNCPGLGFARTVIRHELGHAMGFWHTDSANDVMFVRLSYSTCDVGLSARERYHAAIAYARPAGNADPDSDPVTSVLSLPTKIAY